jgi:hypothetical protein
MPSLNIKNPEAHRLATAITKETGETLTRVLIEALRDHTWITQISFYDEHGLPK